MNTLKKILISSGVLGFYIIAMTFTWGNHLILLPVTLIFVFLYSFWLFNKNFAINNQHLGMLISLPFPIIGTIASIYYNDFSRGLLYIVFIPVFCFLGYLFFRKKKIFILIFSFALAILISKFLFLQVFIYLNNSKSTISKKYKNIELVNDLKKQVVFKSNDIIVLDFWSTSCGICFDKFPDYQEIFNKYKSNNRIKIYAVNVPIRGDNFEKTKLRFNKLKYTFPNLYAKSFKQVEDSLCFNTFPKLMIIQNGVIRYDGMLFTRKESLIYNIEDSIDKLLKE